MLQRQVAFEAPISVIRNSWPLPNRCREAGLRQCDQESLGKCSEAVIVVANAPGGEWRMWRDVARGCSSLQKEGDKYEGTERDWVPVGVPAAPYEAATRANLTNNLIYPRSLLGNVSVQIPPGASSISDSFRSLATSPSYSPSTIG